MKHNPVALNQLRDDCHRSALKTRGIEAIIVTGKFERIWVDSTTEQQKEVTKLVEEVNKEAVILWMRMHPSLKLEDKSTAALRIKAKALHIRYWSRLDKVNLIEEIRKEEKERDAIEARFNKRDTEYKNRNGISTIQSEREGECTTIT